MRARHSSITLVFAVLFTLMLQTSVIFAQTDVASSTEPAPQSESLGKLQTKLIALKDKCDKLRIAINEIRNVTDLENIFEDAEKDLSTYEARLQRLESSSSYQLDKALALHGHIMETSRNLGEASNSIANKLNEYEALNTKWGKERTEWENLRKTSDSLPEIKKSIAEFAEPELDRGDKYLAGLIPDLMKLQSKILKSQRDVKKLSEKVSGFANTLKKNLFKPTGSPMFMPEFFKEFNSSLWHRCIDGFLAIECPIKEFFEENGGTLIFQFILLWLLFLGIKYAGSSDTGETLLKNLIEHYHSPGIFCCLVLTIPMLVNTPAVIGFIYTVIFVIAVMRLSDTVIEDRTMAKNIKVITGILLVIDFLSLISFPPPLMRTFSLIAGLAGAYLIYKKKIFQGPAECSPHLKTIIQSVRNIMFVVFSVIFLTQLFGYGNLSMRLLVTTFRTMFITITSSIFLKISDDILFILFHNKSVQNFVFIKNNSATLLKHTVTALNSFIIFITGATVLSYFGICDNTSDAINTIMTFGFNVRGIDISIGRIVGSLIAIYVTLCISWLTRGLLEEEILPRYGIEKGVIISINRLVYYIFFMICLFIGFTTMGIDIQSLTVILGALGVGIGFGLQNIVNNFASGLILLFERSIRVGDNVVIGGVLGTVKKLGLRATVIQTFENAEMIVPNSDLVSSTVSNWTMTERCSRFSVFVGVAYGTDIEKVTAILLSVANSNPNVMKYPKPDVVFTEFADSSLNFELRAWVKDFAHRAPTQNELMYAVNKAFNENNIEIPFPQHDIHMINPEPEK